MTHQGAPPGSRYQDQRHYVVISDLSELEGPLEGTILLDSKLDWSGGAEYHLDEPGDVIVMYQTVLNEATEPDDLRRWINRNALRDLWASLWLPARLRELWESRFPELAGSPRLRAG